RLYTVNILPDGSPAPNASFGIGGTGNTLASYKGFNTLSHVISADGSRIFWTDISNGSLYVREGDARTSLIAEGARYLTASSDGSKVLYTKGGDLYEDDLDTGVTRDLAPGAELLGLMGAGENLEYIYFVGQGALTGGASAGQSNVYVSHEGHTSLVATLGSEAEEEVTFLIPLVSWSIDQGFRPADVTPSGHDVVFMSRKSLTGYDNAFHVAEVYMYDASSGGLSCVSCDPTGEPGSGGTLSISEHSTYQQHVISDDGNRVFFESADPLLPQAQNGKLNVYEWERDGTGSCTDASGCIYLLSSGSSPYSSYFVDASASGNDVFLFTSSQLVPADQNEYNDIYDARVGVVEASAPTQCTGTGCQGVAASPPVFATPASTTFAGVGNYAPPAAPVAKPKPKKKTSKCTVKKPKKGSKKKPKAKQSAKQAKAKPAPCKAKKAAKRARPGKKARGGR
ncbi:MAG TPA: hypothetical protein VGI52_07560, partial [Solirubrobacteraceae bacterium]